MPNPLQDKESSSVVDNSPIDSINTEHFNEIDSIIDSSTSTISNNPRQRVFFDDELDANQLALGEKLMVKNSFGDYYEQVKADDGIYEVQYQRTDLPKKVEGTVTNITSVNQTINFSGDSDTLKIYDTSGELRVNLGSINSTDYGLKVNASDGSTEVFGLYGSTAKISGFKIDGSKIYQDDGSSTNRVIISSGGASDGATHYIAFGDPARTTYSNSTGNNSNTWLGVEGDTAKISLRGGDDAKVFQYDGTNIVIKGTAGFTLDTSVTPPLVVSSATIGGTTIDGTNIRSSNYQANNEGWQISSGGDAEFRSIVVRGELHASSFVADLFSATAGTQIIAKSSGTLYATMTIPNAADSDPAGNTWNMSIKSPPSGANYLFEVGDFCRIKSISSDSTGSSGSLSVSDIWFIINSRTSVATTHQVYVCQWKDGTVGADMTFNEGSTVIDYGVSGDGFVFSTAESAYKGPHIAIGTHTGSSGTAVWDGTTSRVRIGNLESFNYDGTNTIAADKYGIAAGGVADKGFMYWNQDDGMVIGRGIGNGAFKIFPDANTAIELTDSGGGNVFKVISEGSDAGDVIIGDFDGGDKGGLKWDESLQRFIMRGVADVDVLTTGSMGVLATAITSISGSPQPNIVLHDASLFPNSTGGSYSGRINGWDTFGWTGKSSNTLTGIFGLSSLHPSGSIINFSPSLLGETGSSASTSDRDDYGNLTIGKQGDLHWDGRSNSAGDTYNRIHWGQGVNSQDVMNIIRVGELTANKSMLHVEYSEGASADTNSNVAGIDITFTSETGYALIAENGTGYGIKANAKYPFLITAKSSAPGGTPDEGAIYVNSTDHHIYCYLDGSWTQLDN